MKLTLEQKIAKTTSLIVLEGNEEDKDLPPLMNPPVLEASDDLTSLSHLNEPAGTFSEVAYLHEPPLLTLVSCTQFYRPLNFDMRSVKFTPIPVLSLLQQIRLTGWTISMTRVLCKPTPVKDERIKIPISSRLLIPPTSKNHPQGSPGLGRSKADRKFSGQWFVTRRIKLSLFRESLVLVKPSARNTS